MVAFTGRGFCVAAVVLWDAREGGGGDDATALPFAGIVVGLTVDAARAVALGMESTTRLRFASLAGSAFTGAASAFLFLATAVGEGGGRCGAFAVRVG